MSEDMIQRLTEKRANVWEQAKAHLDTVEKEGREFSGEADETWTRLNDELSGLDKRISEVSDLAVRNLAADEMRAKFQPAAEGKKAAEPSDSDIIRRMASGEIRAHEFRDLSKLSAGAGANTVPTGFYAQLQDYLVANSAIRQTNVRVISTASGEALQVPKITSRPTAAIIAEAGTVTESDPAFGQVTLDAFKYGFSTQISSELETDGAFDLSSELARLGAQAIANGTGTHFITGTGSGQPNGVVTASTLGKTGSTAVVGAFSADDLIDLYYSVLAGYRDNGTWLMQDAAIKAARKLKDTTNQYLWVPGLTSEQPTTFLGRPVLSDPNVAAPALAAKSVVFGDLSTYMIRDVAGVRVERSVDFAFQNDLITYRFLFRTDGDLLDTTGSVKHFLGGAS